MPNSKLHSVLAGLEAGRVRPVARTPEDLFAGRDSIAKLEALLAIEAAFNISLSEEDLAGVRTLTDLERLVDAKCAATPSDEPKPVTQAPPIPPVPVASWGRPVSAVLVFWIRSWFRLKVTGREHLPAGPCLLCPNHTSHVDSLALLAATGPLRSRLVFAAAKDYFFKRPRLARWNRRALPLIPWERGGNAAVMKENLRHLAACRDANRIVVFFPEGSRSPSGELQPFKDGFAFFAVQTGLPVVPCWIEGAHASLPKGASVPRPGRLHVSFGPALQPSAGDEQGFAAAVRAGLLALRPSSS